MWQFVYSAKPKADPRPGTRWRRKGDTLDWELVELTDIEAVLSGPRYCKGLMRVGREEFFKEWVRS